MPTRSKFTAERRRIVVDLLGAGASLRHAAKCANVSHTTLLEWLKRAERAAPGGRWHAFWRDVEAARANPGLRQVDPEEATPAEARWLHELAPDKPTPAEVAWAVKYLETNGWGDEEPPVIKLEFPREPPRRRGR